MCRVFDETRREGAFQYAIEMALRMIKDDALSSDKIALYSGHPLEKVQDLAGTKTA